MTTAIAPFLAADYRLGLPSVAHANDARDLGVLARARVPHPIPFGFHGIFR